MNSNKTTVTLACVLSCCCVVVVPSTIMSYKSLKVRLRSLFNWLLPAKSGVGRPGLCDDRQLEEYEQVYRQAQIVSQASGKL